MENGYTEKAIYIYLVALYIPGVASQFVINTALVVQAEIEVETFELLRLCSAGVYSLSSSMQSTNAWKRKKMMSGTVMRWMSTQLARPYTSASTAPDLPFCSSNVSMSHMAKLKNIRKLHMLRPGMPMDLVCSEDRSW